MDDSITPAARAMSEAMSAHSPASSPVLTLWNSAHPPADDSGGSALAVEWLGRTGWRPSGPGVRVPAEIPQLNAPEGSLTWWLLPREDFATSVDTPWMGSRAPDHQYHVLMGDAPGAASWKNHRFALFYCRAWYQQLVAKWHSGPIYEDHENAAFRVHREKAFVGLGHQNLPAGQWVQLGLSWNTPANDYRMYVNGVLVQTATTTIDHPLLREENSGPVYAGHPLFACGELNVYDRALDAEEFASAYGSSKGPGNEAFDARLARMHEGKGLAKFDWEPTGDWNRTVDLPLASEADLGRFYQQGMPGAVTLTDEGVRIRTSPIHTSEIPKPADWTSEEPFDPAQGYLWLEDYFTGDFAVEYEFKPLQNHGLSLLMVRAAGLQGEDFLKSQPRRISGSMRMVCWENVRNYHWEYYRQMEDARNDVASHVLVKNPYMHPIGYQATDSKLAVGQWHRIQFVHEGKRLRGAMDGVQIFDVVDDPFAGFGPVLRTGTLAIRCMWDTDIVFRNLHVWTKAEQF
ncbi:MAG: DUF1961 family protein [Spartobacteria bacterium]